MPREIRHVDDARIARRMLKKAVQRGRSERRGEASSLTDVELLSDARTKLVDFFNILLIKIWPFQANGQIIH
jgi:hypothetical protein